ncbi:MULTISPECIES: hypothetical protein [Planktothrix]|uniref:Uncharacterized protein n=1 Tax=Planktothrix mougeotii LEGE 06226 TaxID=1828728 RepID=A0ABR9UC46_9CYAN|nr:MULTISPECIES: hypothetical protein [Planktothrix]MBD2484883.1 hypothetical protein [Planktothrix sp. FACHB-1365]MBE9143756.1 hypothetical protein [Planktothrix mougeotii LEGE 06226]
MHDSSVKSPTRNFSLLAPVPEIHLISAQEVCEQEGKVAFGSREFEVFRKIDLDRNERPVKVLIYASEQENRSFIPKVTWQGLYIGHSDSRRGRHPQGMKYRPATAANDALDAAIFWEVTDLRPLEIPVNISNFKGLGKKEPFASRFVPEKPLIIQYF